MLLTPLARYLLALPFLDHSSDQRGSPTAASPHSSSEFDSRQLTRPRRVGGDFAWPVWAESGIYICSAQANPPLHPDPIKRLHPPTSSPSKPMPTICPFRSRIHRRACWRGGAGAGREGETRNLVVRVRRKWSPSGDMGRGEGKRTGLRLLMLEERAGRACAIHTWWPDWMVSPDFMSAETSGSRRQKPSGRDRRETAVAGKNWRTGH